MNEQVNGVIVVDKPENIYTGDIVEKVKRRFRVKVGHCGVIDYIGSGIVVLLVNGATKISDFLLNADKEYIATVLLGKKTDTMDITGNVLEENNYSSITKEKIIEVASQFVGEINLLIPMFSNKKINGVPLHKLARQSPMFKINIPKIFSTVKIYSLELIKFELPYFTFKVKCSKGTYIRSLIDTIGNRLGIGATMYSLRRTAVGNFTLDKAVKLHDIMDMDIETFKKFVISPNEALTFLPEIEIRNEYVSVFIGGGYVPIKYEWFKVQGLKFQVQDYVRVTFMGELLGVGKIYTIGGKFFVKSRCVLVK